MRAQPTQEWVFGESSAEPPDGRRLFKPVSERPGRTEAYRICVILQGHQFKWCTLTCWNKLAGSEPRQVHSTGLTVSSKIHSGLNTLPDSLI